MTQEQIAGILLVLISIAIMIFPKLIWKIAESWKNKEKVAPSDSYLIVARCVGAGLLIVGIVVML